MISYEVLQEVFMVKQFSMELAGRTFSVEIGKVAAQANGAALVRYFADSFGDMPVMRVERIGYGMGKKEFSRLNAVRALLGEVSRCRDTIRQYEVEISRIVKETDANEKLQRSVRLEAANAKKSFDQLKADYEEESKSKKGELESQRAKAKDLMDKVDPPLLEEYETIKKHISPPVARLAHGQCSGCNTSLPSAILSKIRNGSLVECETCGRLIIP